MTDFKDPKPASAGDLARRAAAVLLTPHLIQQAPEQAAEVLDRLPLEDRARVVARLAGKVRLDLILASREAEALIQALPPPELWITIKQVGMEDSLDLLRMASADQLQYLHDLECWHQDRVDPLAFAYWIMVMNQAGPEVVVRWFNQADEEYLISVLGRFFTVHRVDPDNQGAEPWREFNNLWTLDDVYYLHFPDPNLAPTIEQMLSTIRAEWSEKFYSLLDLTDALATPETEDRAARLRWSRLETYGFVEPDEALEIYAPLSDRELETARAADDVSPRGRPLPGPGIEYPLAISPAAGRLGAAMAKLDAEAQADVALGLGALVNRILIADHLDLSKLESVEAALEKAAAFVEMGLARFAGADPDQAAIILASQGVIPVFRAGYTAAFDLARRAHRFRREGWIAAFPSGLELLAEDGDAIKGLLKARPRCFAGADKKGAPTFREFQTTADVERAALALARAETLGELFLDAFGLTAPELGALKPADPGETLDFEKVFLTAAVGALAGRGFGFAPLSLPEAKAGLEAFFGAGRERPPDDLKRALLGRAEEAFSRLAAATPEKLELVRAFVAGAIERLEAEAKDVDLTALDPRFFTLLAIAPAG